MEIVGYAAAALIGVALGMIGGGGSILTLPVLVYLFGVPVASATGYSLFVVGATALAGSVAYVRRGLVDFRVAILFGAPSIAAVYAVRAFVMPILPKHWFSIGSFEVGLDRGLLLLFAALMLGTAVSMLRNGGHDAAEEREGKGAWPWVLAEGLGVGVATGLVGAGGGFLIVPALVLLAGLPMRTAVGTSLAIIAAKSLLGFMGDLQSGARVDWALLGTVTLLAVAGIGLGAALAPRVPAARLKGAFGVFVLIMAIVMVGREFALG